MKHLSTIVFLIILSTTLNAQLSDAQWVIGSFIGTCTLDFRADTVGRNVVPGSMGTAFTNANICDEWGNLLYYTNGFYINGDSGNLILNGDTLSPCAYTTSYYLEGLDVPQGAIFLPAPGDTSRYYIFHFSLDTFDDTRPATLYYSVIDKNGDSGRGAVTKKNIPILQNTPLRGGGMTACKHANGRDYWVVMGASDTGIFYKFLLTPDSVFGPFLQAIGPNYNTSFDLAYSKFSQDGGKFVTGCGEGPVLVMDFDRCSGEFSNPIAISNLAPPPYQPLSGASSVEFSPNGDFLYVCNVVNLNQYDLRALPGQDSIQLYLADSSDFYQMNMWQAAPNGKLYGSTWNGGLYALHLINYPDSLSLACGFVYGGQPTLSYNSINLPNLTNYNLGPLHGSGCDTIPDSTVGIRPTVLNNLLRVMPNPADKYLYVEMGMQGDYEFDLINGIGQVVDRKETRQVDDFDTEGLASGVYFLKVIDKSKTSNILTRKVVVQH